LNASILIPLLLNRGVIHQGEKMKIKYRIVWGGPKGYILRKWFFPMEIKVLLILSKFSAC